MSLAIDARWMGPGCRGMGRHASNFVSPVIDRVVGLVPDSSFKLNFATLRSGPSAYPIWEQIWLPYLCFRLNIGTLICPYNTAPFYLPAHTKLILVVHDLIFMSSWREIPPSFRIGQEMGRLYRKLLLPHIIHKAYKVITVSEYSKRRIIAMFGLAPDQVSVIPNSIGSEWFAQEPISIDLRQPYILAVSGEAPSKNLANLIRAFSVFRALCPQSHSKIRLRVVGVKQSCHSRFHTLAQTFGVKAYVDFEAYIPHEQLIELYRYARLFVMPSLSEGFGIPLIEAMAAGAPVACSNTASLPEVAGDCCFFFDPNSINDIAQTLHAAFSNPSACEQNIASGVIRSRLFSTSAVSRKSAAFWQSVL